MSAEMDCLNGDKQVRTILITGVPGIGKTTLVRSICEELQHSNNFPIYGFYTEDKRNELNERTGFEVVSLDGAKRGILAKITNAPNMQKIGKYSVFVRDFEDVVMPILETKDTTSKRLCVIDELGKMELLSRKFESIVNKKIDEAQIMLATVPMRTRQPIPIINRLQLQDTTRVFLVTRSNRQHLQQKIIHLIRAMMEK